MSRFRTQVTEVINRNALVTLALERGYNAFLPVFDGGIDFVLYSELTGDLLKVQLKGRWYIDKKYVERDIWIAFRDGEQWYVAPHDALVTAAAGYGFTTARSWLEGNAYSCPKLSKNMKRDLEPYRFGSVEVEAEGALRKPDSVGTAKGASH